jgi:RHS repeat-associated protein
MKASSSGYPNVPAPKCKCKCDCYKGDGGKSPDEAGGAADPALGEPVQSAPDLSQNGAGGFNMGLGEGLEYSSNGMGAGSGKYGNHWVNPHQPQLAFDGGSVLLESGAGETVSFIKAGSGFVAEYYVRDVLQFDKKTELYTITYPEGIKKVFDKNGAIQSMVNAFGNEAKFTYVGGELVSVAIGSDSEAIGYFYTFDTLGRLESVIMRVGGITATHDYRRISYVYTNTGSLELVKLDEKRAGVWVEIETSYYRYFTSGRRLLRFVLGDHAYKQIKSVNANWPEQATDAQLAEFAEAEYAYHRNGKVSMVKTNGGKYTYQFSYKKSAHSGSTANVWTSRTNVKHPDGSLWSYYYNRSLSLLLLKVSAPQGGGERKTWFPICQQFDANSRLIYSASSSAVESVDESQPTLFTLKLDTGLLHTRKYDPFGNLVQTGLKKGMDGPIVKQREFTYLPKTVRSVSIYVPATETIYQDATESAASNPAVTSFAYTWYKKGKRDTFQIKTLTTTLPAVPNSENGDNAAGVSLETYDRNGFLIKSIDELGVATTYQYYTDKGALKKMVQDAGSGRLNLATEYEVDPLGRTILEKGPAHTISHNGVATNIKRCQWTQYLDSDDETRTIHGYLKVSDSSVHTVNPVQIERRYAADPQVSGGRMEESIAAVYSGAGVPAASQSFPQSTYVRWQTRHFSKQDKHTHFRLYHLIPASGFGTSGTNYAQTTYGYDAEGRQNRITSPEGTIILSIFNVLSWPTKERVGTTDANLVTTVIREYDNGVAAGDGNLTKVTLRVDGTSASERATHYRYNWRDRQIEIEANDGTRTLVTQRKYDNRDNVIQVDEYQVSIATANLLNRAETFFDARNRSYRSKRYGVEVGTGTLQSALTGQFYYDQTGRLVRDEPAGKVGFTIHHYDAVSRTKKVFRAYGGTLNLANPGNVSDATVVEQTEHAYDKAGNQLSMVMRQRFDNATGTGELKNPTTQPKARASYEAKYPDAIGRLIAQANFGTNGGSSWSRPTTLPARSDTVLVSSFVFDDAGNQIESVDPMDTRTRLEFDQAGRQIKQIENYIPGGPSQPDVNRTTRFEYNDDGNMRKLIAENSTTGDQVTEWIYGVTTAQGSAINSNALLYQKIYPDSTGSTDRVTYRYNRQRETTWMKDQASTQHGYSYDKFGRLTEDVVLVFGSPNLDTAIRKIRRSYESRGMLEKVSSYGTGTTPVNEVLFVYNDYSQLAKDYQEHDGAVNPASTLKVEYIYADGTQNTIRRTGIKYPDGTTEITTAYLGTAADALSRPDALKEDTTTLCSYRYLGIGVFVGVKYDAASNVELTYEAGGTGDAGDQYTGLDRFGRLVETLWKKGSAEQVRSKYGRNRFGGVVWRRDLAAHVQSVNTEDSYYWYDGLYQVKEHQRGNLIGTSPNYTGIDNLRLEEDWSYDASGNWSATTSSNYTEGEVLIGTLTNLGSGAFDFGHLIGTPPVNVGDTIKVNGSTFTLTAVTVHSPQDPATEDGYYEVTVAESTSGLSDGDPIEAAGWRTLPQTRQQNQANEITYLWPPGTTAPEYDAVGNMTLIPPILGTSTDARSLQWDAWNRLVEFQDGSATALTYRYDGLTRRLTKARTNKTRHYYYSDQWRAIEERVDGASVAVERQYVWGLRDRWDLLRRKSFLDINLENILFIIRDYLDPVAVINADGLIVERYSYDTFGHARFLDSNFSPRIDSEQSWNFLFHAEFRDSDTNLYNYGYRYYSTQIGRWLSRDPLLESNGNEALPYKKGKQNTILKMDLYQFCSNGPSYHIDIKGKVGQIVGGAIIGCAGGAAFSLLTSWLADENRCQCLCKAGANCIAGALAGGLVAANPALGGCLAGFIGGGVGAGVGKACDKFCGVNNDTPLACVAASIVVSTLIGCLVGPALETVPAAQVEANNHILSGIVGTVSTLLGYDVESYCGIATSI